MSLKYCLQYVKMVKIVDERRHTDTDISWCSGKRKRMQMSLERTALSVWADATTRRVQTLDVCSRTFGTYYSRQAATSRGGVGHYAAHRSLVWGIASNENVGIVGRDKGSGRLPSCEDVTGGLGGGHGKCKVCLIRATWEAACPTPFICSSSKLLVSLPC